MTDTPASFSDLAGFGPADEARLHEAGVYSWRALNQVLNTIGHLHRDGDERLRGLREAVASRAAEELVESDGERSEAFIVRLAVNRQGTALRSAVIHLRSGAEHPNAGWRPKQLTGFIEDCCRLARVGSIGASGDTDRPLACGSRGHVVELDAGLALGGPPRDIDLVVATGTSPAPPYPCRATLARRAYGRAPAVETDWAVLAEWAGHVRPPHDLRCGFERVSLPPGPHRLRLQIVVRLSGHHLEAPALELR
jgi:hypothetical protein